MKLNRKSKAFSVPVFSMSDIAFLLLIFIMLVSLINYRTTVNIQYTVAEEAKKVSADKNLEIWVNREGSLYLNGNPSNTVLIEEAVKEAYREDPETRVHIIADRDTAFVKIHDVLEILQLMQYRMVSLVVKNE